MLSGRGGVQAGRRQDSDRGAMPSAGAAPNAGEPLAKPSVKVGHVFELKNKVSCHSKCQACHVSTGNIIKN